MNIDFRAGSHDSVEAELPSGAIVRVRVAEGLSGGLNSVGIGEKLQIEGALAEIAEMASLVRRTLQPCLPSKATVAFGVSLSAEPGKLTSVFFESKANASLTVTLEWERRPEATTTVANSELT